MPIEPKILERIVRHYLEKPGAQFKIKFSENVAGPLFLLGLDGIILDPKDALRLQAVCFGGNWGHIKDRTIIITIERTLNVNEFVTKMANALDLMTPLNTVSTDN